MTPVQVRRTRTALEVNPGELPRGENIFVETHMQELWNEAIQRDKAYLTRLQAVKEGAKTFPEEAKTVNQIGDCTINAQWCRDRFTLRERIC